jgi:hypothetical protein
MYSSAEVTSHIFDFSSIVLLCLKSLESRVSCHNFDFLFIPARLSPINTTLSAKKHTPRDILLYVPCDIMHYQSKKGKGLKLTLVVVLFFYREVIRVPITCSNNIGVHVLNESNILFGTLCLFKAHHIMFIGILL